MRELSSNLRDRLAEQRDLSPRLLQLSACRPASLGNAYLWKNSEAERIGKQGSSLGNAGLEN
jgi:hypothetical protein